MVSVIHYHSQVCFSALPFWFASSQTRTKLLGLIDAFPSILPVGQSVHHVRQVEVSSQALCFFHLERASVHAAPMCHALRSI